MLPWGGAAKTGLVGFVMAVQDWAGAPTLAVPGIRNEPAQGNKGTSSNSPLGKHKNPTEISVVVTGIKMFISHTKKFKFLLIQNLCSPIPKP